ncbi:MAG TPA: twin-arginine translocation signal domain-containing protein [Gemmatimonadaceae bacterium]|nr:twin-arginine translocation signal domain-containing protein [Gemmatimonadaceae bacterium]
MTSPSDPVANVPTRRDFLGALAATGAALALSGCTTAGGANASTSAAATPAPAPSASLPPAKNDGPWDNSWMARVSQATHRQVFDCPSYQDGGALFFAKNYLNAMRDAFDSAAPAVQVAIGLHGDAYPIAFSDAMWAKYKFGERVKAKDPRTNQFATRNVLWQPREGEETYEYSVNALQSRGAIILLCNNVLRRVIRGIMGDSKRSYADVRGELVAGLLPGVIVVPAMAAAIGLAQEHGCSYVYAG